MAFVFIGVLLGLAFFACVAAVRAFKTPRARRRHGTNSPDTDSPSTWSDIGTPLIWLGHSNDSVGGASGHSGTGATCHHAGSHHDHGHAHHDVGGSAGCDSGCGGGDSGGGGGSD
jgi:hypothetical protein